MNRNYWRVFAGLLAVTLGTIVVIANDTKPKPTTPVAEHNCPECAYEPCCSMPCPPCPTQCPSHCENPLPECPAAVIACPTPCIPVPPIAPTVASEEIKPVPAGLKPVVMTTTVVDMPYKVRMVMVAGVANVELMRGDEVALKIQYERIAVQMPGGGLRAIGTVCVTAPGIEVHCNRLLCSWSTGDIAMEGQVRIVCQNGQQKTQMVTESICCRLNSVGTGLEFSEK